MDAYKRKGKKEAKKGKRKFLRDSIKMILVPLYLGLELGHVVPCLAVLGTTHKKIAQPGMTQVLWDWKYKFMCQFVPPFEPESD